MVSNFVSFFAPFLLILQLNQDKIGCKSEAKRNKKRRRNMNQADIEKYAFSVFLWREGQRYFT